MRGNALASPASIPTRNLLTTEKMFNLLVTKRPIGIERRQERLLFQEERRRSCGFHIPSETCKGNGLAFALA